MGVQRFRLPDVGEGLTEAEILTWHVAVGQTVKINDVIVEIETAKASVELPCPFAGTVTALLVAEGTVVPVGTPIIEVEVADAPDGPPVATHDGGDGTQPQTAAPTPQNTLAPTAASAPVAEPAATREAVLVGYGVAGSSTKRRQKISGHTKVPTSTSFVASGAQVIARTKPPIRALAKQHGIDLRTVAPTGRHGDITRDDVMRAASGGVVQQTRTPAPFTPNVIGTPRERIPVRGVLRSMAQAMVQSAFTAPHVTCWLEVDVSAATSLVAKLRQDSAFAGSRVTLLTLAALGTIRATQEFGRLNSSWIEGADGAEIVVHGHVGLGIAVAGSKGLVVPVIAESETLSAPQLAAAVTGLVERARNGTTTPAEMVGGTISITNIGALGMDAGTPILVPGQAAILAVGRVTRKPWVVTRDGVESVEIRDIATLALSFDHRILDGEAGAKSLRAIATFLADPILND